MTWLKTSEVPVHFYKDRRGRVSHHKRAGWHSPWLAAWINLRVMFVYGADFFVLRPGLLMLLLGLGLATPLTFGPFQVGRFQLSLHWMLLSVILSILGLQSVYFGILARFIYDPFGLERDKWIALFSYTRAVAVAMALVLVGFCLGIPILVSYVRLGLRLPPVIARESYLVVEAVLLITYGFLTFCFTLLLHAIDIQLRASSK